MFLSISIAIRFSSRFFRSINNLILASSAIGRGDLNTKVPEIKTDKDFYYNVQRRRYGGDIQGIIDKLDYLNDLGVNALYLNPVFESPSLHKYGATLLHHIDNNFGPNPENYIAIIQTENPASPKTWQWTSADKLFLDLIKECHSRDMKIIIDGVFNHVGIDNGDQIEIFTNVTIPGADITWIYMLFS